MDTETIFFPRQHIKTVPQCMFGTSAWAVPRTRSSIHWDGRHIIFESVPRQLYSWAISRKPSQIRQLFGKLIIQQCWLMNGAVEPTSGYSRAWSGCESISRWYPVRSHVSWGSSALMATEGMEQALEPGNSIMRDCITVSVALRLCMLSCF